MSNNETPRSTDAFGLGFSGGFTEQERAAMSERSKSPDDVVVCKSSALSRLSPEACERELQRRRMERELRNEAQATATARPSHVTTGEHDDEDQESDTSMIDIQQLANQSPENNKSSASGSAGSGGSSTGDSKWVDDGWFLQTPVGCEKCKPWKDDRLSKKERRNCHAAFISKNLEYESSSEDSDDDRPMCLPDLDMSQNPPGVVVTRKPKKKKSITQEFGLDNLSNELSDLESNQDVAPPTSTIVTNILPDDREYQHYNNIANKLYRRSESRLTIIAHTPSITEATTYQGVSSRNPWHLQLPGCVDIPPALAWQACPAGLLAVRYIIEIHL